MKIHIVGTRPNFVKLKGYLNPDEKNYIIHTGQHYDNEMSAEFFEKLSIPEPDVNLNVAKNSLVDQCTAMQIRLERALEPIYRDGDEIIVYGDCITALAAALVARLHNYPLTHVESGVRHENEIFPEDIIRRTVDHMSTKLICPYDYCEENLRREGVRGEIIIEINPMVTTLKEFLPKIRASDVLEEMNLEVGEYYVLTVHRSAHTNIAWLERLFNALRGITRPVVFPMHPRTKGLVRRLDIPESVMLTEPKDYIGFLALVNSSAAVITDSGGLQLETFVLNKRCYTLNNETCWLHTTETNTIVGDKVERLRKLLKE